MGAHVSSMSLSMDGRNTVCAGTDIHGQRMTMPSVSAVDIAAVCSRRLEDIEVARSGVSIPTARAAVARRIGVSPGTLENLRRGRLKTVCADLFLKISTAAERALRQETERLSHELALIRASGRRVDPRALGEAEAELARARAVLNDVNA